MICAVGRAVTLRPGIRIGVYCTDPRRLVRVEEAFNAQSVAIGQGGAGLWDGQGFYSRLP